jgi:hypothetical protein
LADLQVVAEAVEGGDAGLDGVLEQFGRLLLGVHIIEGRRRQQAADRELGPVELLAGLASSRS